MTALRGGVGSTGLGGALMSAGPAGAPATATITHSTFSDNRAVGGGSTGGSAGTGTGGGLYLAPGGLASAGFTAVFLNDADASDDVFGILV